MRSEKLNANNYVDLAEQAILNLKKQAEAPGKTLPVATTSKIRNLLAQTSEIYHEIQNSANENLSEEITGRIHYLKVRIVYEAGREPSVRKFVEETSLLDHLDDVKGSREQYILFSRYMEALVAYRKFYIGRDE